MENGIEALLEKSRSNPRIGNRVFEEFEKVVLDYSLEYPTHGQTRAFIFSKLETKEFEITESEKMD